MRILGRDIPDNKIVYAGLKDIYGIGKNLAFKILSECGIYPFKRIKELSEREVSKIISYVENNGIIVEGDLRKLVQDNIKRLKDIRCYRGLRHISGLPVRGQRTHSNSRTRKGPKKHRIGRRRK